MYAKKNKTKWLPMPSAIWKLNPTEIIFLRLIWNDQSTTEHLKNKKKRRKIFSKQKKETSFLNKLGDSLSKTFKKYDLWYESEKKIQVPLNSPCLKKNQQKLLCMMTMFSLRNQNCQTNAFSTENLT